MHGLGNDYIYLNLIDKQIPNLSYLAKVLSDRHFGIGGDGIIAILSSKVADFKMRIFNADGSEAEMCGNGIRCVGKYLYDKHITDKEEISIETLAGIKYLTLNVKNDKVVSVKVDMGVPTLHNGEVFSLAKARHMINSYNKDYEVIDVSVGNPHAVIFTPELSDYVLRTSGMSIEGASYYQPNRTNVEFVKILNDREIAVRVYERGVGETLSCGTGACASAFAYMETHPKINAVMVNLLGGNLLITKEGNHLFMEGAATKVFEGDINLNELEQNSRLVLKRNNL